MQQNGSFVFADAAPVIWAGAVGLDIGIIIRDRNGIDPALPHYLVISREIISVYLKADDIIRVIYDNSLSPASGLGVINYI